MELNEHQLRVLKEKELEMLKVLIEVCDRLGLKYYVVGGTLLGAVRHQGFIPWDDDIDVAMLRDDYEVLLQKGQELLPEGYFLQSFHTDPEFPANFAKMRNSNSTFVESSYKDRRVNHGIFIDIFPLDYYPEKGQRLFDAKNLLMKLRITDAFTPGNMKCRTKIVRLVSRLLYPSVKYALARQEKLFRSVTEGSRLANHCGAWGKREIIPAHWYGEGVSMDFEGIKVSAPTHYDLWLTQLYGDYMQLPPEHQRVSHHYVEAFDPEVSYRHYISKK